MKSWNIQTPNFLLLILTVPEEANGNREGERFLPGGGFLQHPRCHLAPGAGQWARRPPAQHCAPQLATQLEAG